MGTPFPGFYYCGRTLLHIWDGMLVTAAYRQNLTHDELSMGFPTGERPAQFARTASISTCNFFIYNVFSA
jgi:hypothetical protein